MDMPEGFAHYLLLPLLLGTHKLRCQVSSLSCCCKYRLHSDLTAR